MNFKDLVGKTITSTTHMRYKDLDDIGFLKLTFSDGTHCIIESSYGGYTENSRGEYPTNISILDDPEDESELVPL